MDVLNLRHSTRFQSTHLQTLICWMYSTFKFFKFYRISMYTPAKLQTGWCTLLHFEVLLKTKNKFNNLYKSEGVDNLANSWDKNHVKFIHWSIISSVHRNSLSNMSKIFAEFSTVQKYLCIEEIAQVRNVAWTYCT